MIYCKDFLQNHEKQLRKIPHNFFTPKIYSQFRRFLRKNSKSPEIHEIWTLLGRKTKMHEISNAWSSCLEAELIYIIDFVENRWKINERLQELVFDWNLLPITENVFFYTRRDRNSPEIWRSWLFSRRRMKTMEISIDEGLMLRCKNPSRSSRGKSERERLESWGKETSEDSLFRRRLFSSVFFLVSKTLFLFSIWKSESVYGFYLNIETCVWFV